MNIKRNFTAGKMNKMLDERLIPNGEYIDAVNVRAGSSEGSEIGTIENSLGNTKLTFLSYQGIPISDDAKCIGAFEDGANETIYWFVHDSNFTASPTGKLDLIVSFNTITNFLVYHTISVNDGSGNKTTLNFNPAYLITGINLVDDLLFFSEFYNPPRCINTKRNYSNPSGTPLVDGNGDAALLQESLLVIKKPPHSAPQIELTVSPGEENYLEERFVCFAYRYEYEDDEYSATSQFSDIAFSTQPFKVGSDSGLNEGVINRFNTAIITYNSGGPLVTAIELLFKDGDDTVIKVIEKIKKSELGIADNTEYTYSFVNSKIFTILPDSELLRLYDNVPLLAKAQTLMGNRLMYGNYIENYNLIDANDSPVRLEYSAKLINELIGFQDVPDDFSDAAFLFGSSRTVPDSRLDIDLSSAATSLNAGSSLTFDLSFTHASFFGASTPTEQTAQTDIEFSYVLPQDFSSVYELANSVDFKDKIGTLSNINPVYSSDPLVETSCSGLTFTDAVNCAVPNVLDATQPTTWSKYESGINLGNQPIEVISTLGSDIISFQIIAMRRVDDVVTPVQSVYEYFSWNFAEVFFQKITETRSLHSNRDYETGIIYMDDYSRASTSLVSPNNSVNVPCSFSDLINTIQITIPVTQLPPYWATKYKFAIKPDKEKFETIYSNIFFTNPKTNITYFLLEGENQKKVETGDRYIVKQDAFGAVKRCAYATVLNKESQESDFLNISDGGEDVALPAGVYMEMKVNDFNIARGEAPYILPGRQSDETRGNNSPVVSYKNLGEAPVSPSTTWTNFSIPIGSRIELTFEMRRQGTGKGTRKCERRNYTLETNLVSSNDYDDIIDWWNGDNVEQVLNSGIQDVGRAGACEIENVYLPTLASPAGNDIPSSTLCTNYYQWWKNPATEEIRLLVSGTKACAGGTGKKRRSSVTVDIKVYRADSTIVWETIPGDSQPDVWYEGSQTFDIVKEGCLYDLTVLAAEPDPIVFQYTVNGVQKQVIVNPGETISNINGDCNSMSISQSTPPLVPTNVTISSINVQNAHLGNVQSQTATQPAIIDTSFFNCFAFGNGVESYRIRDSIEGKTFLLGNRFTTTSAEDYRQANRFSDITYGGIYNDESNVNKLNEFNLGLSNFKTLEESFGPIQLLYGRSTDVLSLQEDKISYVLAGKNLLSDSTQGGSIASVPEVLGTQIARLEEFGISFNPESFAVYGYDKYFSDQKRGVLIQLRGSGYSNEQLTVISEQGMRPWFRDEFIQSPNTQKIGGYDPYMDEYVFSTNDTLLPVESNCIDCGITQFISYQKNNLNLCFNVGGLIGPVDVEVIVTNLQVGDPLNLNILYNSETTNQDLSPGGNVVTFNKDKVLVETVDLTFSGDVIADLEITVKCPDAKTITIIQVCVSDNADAGEFIHNEYRWLDGAFVSPLHSEQVELVYEPNVAAYTYPIVSQYSSVTGLQGEGVIPATGSICAIISNRIEPIDNFDFTNPPNNFKWLRTSDVYSPTSLSVQALITAANTLTPVGLGTPSSTSLYTGNFVMPTGGDGDYLYLIYDYRKPTLVELCFSETRLLDVCCGCNQNNTFLAQQCRQDGVVNTEVVSGPYNLGDFVEINGCIFNLTAEVEGGVTAQVTALSEVQSCDEVCQEYSLLNTTAGQIIFDYNNCDGEIVGVAVNPGETAYVCATIIVAPVGIDITLNSCECPSENTLVNLERCVALGTVNGTNPQIATSNGLYNVGDFVTINSEPNCVYRVVSYLSDGTPTAIITSVTAIQSCDEVCNAYAVSNETTRPQNISYIECDDTPVILTILPGDTARLVCIKGNFLSLGNVVVNFVACQCV